MKTTVEHPYITQTEDVCGGEPCIIGTRIAVRIIVGCWRGGMSPEEMHEVYPHITLAQIFDALSYAEDHTEQIEQLIREDRAIYEAGIAAQSRKLR